MADLPLPLHQRHATPCDIRDDEVEDTGLLGGIEGAHAHEGFAGEYLNFS
jgi:hypothetical protein